MKAKTIRKVLAAKLRQLVNSISLNDPELGKLVAKNTIITGGCIPSMLLRDPVNDYDIYFRTKDVAARVAKYYVDLFAKDFREDCGFEVQVLEDRVKIVIPSAGVAQAPSIESGDCDDPFMELEEIEGEPDSPETEIKAKCRPLFLSANAITLSEKVQIVVRFFGEPEQIHSNYDFEHCLSYWTSWDENLVLSPAALESILTKELRYVGSKYPLCSIIRTRKFIARNWTINAGQFLKMAMQLNELDLNDVNVLEDQLTGVDALFFTQLIDQIREKNPDKVDAGYLATIIDKIF